MKARIAALAALCLVGGIVGSPAAHADQVIVNCAGNARLIYAHRDIGVGGYGFMSCPPHVQHLLTVEIQQYTYLCLPSCSRVGLAYGINGQDTQGIYASATATLYPNMSASTPVTTGYSREYKITVTDHVKTNPKWTIATGISYYGSVSYRTTCTRDGAKNKAICIQEGFYVGQSTG